MTIEIKVPALPESVADATVAKWYKQVGDTVKRDENLVDLETDKVMLEVPALVDGILTAIDAPEGSVVESDALLGIVTEGAIEPASAEAIPVQAGSEASSQVIPVSESALAPAQASSTPQVAGASSSASDVLSPSVRRLVGEAGVETAHIQGTGKNGRLLKTDVLSAMQSDGIQAVMPPDREQRVPMSRLRMRVAERLMQAKHSTAMLTTFNEIDMKSVMNLRAQYKDLFMKTHDTKLGFMSFFVKATVEALKRYPTINASIDGQDIIYHNYFDIGVAVSSPRGLVVPVIRNVDQLSMADIENAIIDYATKAKNNQLSLEEMTGGTFTITNGGVFGSMLSTPILNPPQCGILGMHNIVERPVVVDGEIVVRPVMYVALSYDHQLVDGRESVGFLVTIKQLLEDPARILLGL